MVVVKTSHLKYVVVGNTIQEFTTLAPVTRIESYVGNSDVPYPCVVDAEHNVYLLLESVVMKHVTKKQVEPFGDVYRFYYAKCQLCAHKHGVGFEGIQTFYVNNNPSFMSERDYVAVMKRFAKVMNFQGFKLVTLVEPN